MALSNTATPKYYGMFRDAVIRGEIPVCETIEMEMNRIDALGKEYKRLNYKKQINELNKYFDAEKKKASNSSDEAPKKEEPKKEERVYEGIVEDEETSRRTRSYNDGPRPTSSPIDVDFEDVDTGRRYITGLLEDPRKKKK